MFIIGLNGYFTPTPAAHIVAIDKIFCWHYRELSLMAQLREHLPMLHTACLLGIDVLAEFSKSWLNKISIKWRDANVTQLLHRYLAF